MYREGLRRCLLLRYVDRFIFRQWETVYLWKVLMDWRDYSVTVSVLRVWVYPFFYLRGDGDPCYLRLETSWVYGTTSINCGAPAPTVTVSGATGSQESFPVSISGLAFLTWCGQSSVKYHPSNFTSVRGSCVTIGPTKSLLKCILESCDLRSTNYFGNTVLLTMIKES